MKPFVASLVAVALGLSASAPCQSSGIDVDVVRLTPGVSPMKAADRAAVDFGLRLARLTEKARTDLARAGRFHPELPFAFPQVLRLKQAGAPLRWEGGRSLMGGGGIALAFDSSGPRAFPTEYQTFLTNVFNQAQGTLNAVFGAPSWNGTVFVRNYDADIQDRYAVVGGYFVPNNGSGQAEIRFPVYSAPEAAAVNFIHCLLLAYLGPNSYGFDAFQEGLVRAAVMKVVRTAGSLPTGLDPQVVESVLENTYDVGTFYDWYNQRALGGRSFVAPNLLNTQLPIGGSLGGIYLLRYQMAGSAWLKTLAENAAFIKTFNEQFYLNPSIGNDVPALVTLGQSVLDSLLGPGATVEGRPFAEWFRRQFILETGDTLGLKLLVQPVPIPPLAGSSDFGVFLIQATYFETLAGGDEVLLSGVSFPIFWSNLFDRIFPSTQEDRMDIAGAYGSVAPNLPNLQAGQPYRCAVDIPVQDRIARCYVPAGAVATGANPQENDFYGTVVGVPGGTGVTVRVRVTIGLDVTDNIPVTNNAFGFRFANSTFLSGEKKVRVEVIRRQNNLDTVVIDRQVNKGPGPLALDLRTGLGEATFTPANGLPKGLSTIGFPVDPLSSLAGTTLNIPEGDVLLARWNSSKARHEIYPDCGPITQGQGYFVRLDAAQPGYSVPGRTSPGIPVAVALRPGWNLITTPINETVPTGRVTVVRATDFPKDYADAVGVELGSEFFAFVPGPPDAATGAPETGTMTPATSFEPGKAYFVRVLAAEGASLLFRPLTQLPPDSNVRRVAASVAPGEWRLALSLRDGSHVASAQIGQSPGATRGFDAWVDSGLPPSPGGMQLQADGPEPMYREVRGVSPRESFRFRAVGLIPGKRYRLTGVLERGRLRRYVFRDLATMQWRPVSGALDTEFVAGGATRSFEIRVDGASW